MKSVLIAGLLSAAALPAMAANVAPEAQRMLDYVNSSIISWVQTPETFAAIAAQNAKHSGMSQSQIIAMDNTWRAEVGQSDTPLITSVLATDLSAQLADVVTASDGSVTEIFVMDNLGLNVAQSAVTSDYWQGDEAKFTKTYAMGADAVHVSEIEFDESTQSYQAQVSMTLSDPATGRPIGAVTFGLNAEAFF